MASTVSTNVSAHHHHHHAPTELKKKASLLSKIGSEQLQCLEELYKKQERLCKEIRVVLHEKNRRVISKIITPAQTISPIYLKKVCSHAVDSHNQDILKDFTPEEIQNVEDFLKNLLRENVEELTEKKKNLSKNLEASINLVLKICKISRKNSDYNQSIIEHLIMLHKQPHLDTNTQNNIKRVIKNSAINCISQKTLPVVSDKPLVNEFNSLVLEGCAEYYFSLCRLPHKSKSFDGNKFNASIKELMAQMCCEGKHGGFIERIQEGSGGVYKIGITVNNSKIPLFVFKHRLEEPGMPLGKGFFDDVLRENFPLGESLHKEYLLSSGSLFEREHVYMHLKSAQLPDLKYPTHLSQNEIGQGEGLLIDYIQSEGTMFSFEFDSDDPGKLQNQPQSWKIKAIALGFDINDTIYKFASTQKFFTEDKCDFDSLQRIIIQDLLYLNMDSNSGNILLVPLANGKCKLEGIDKGQCLPKSPKSLHSFFNRPFWKDIPQLQRNLTPTFQSQILSLDIEEEIEFLRNGTLAKGYKIEEVIFENLRASYAYLKESILADKSLREITNGYAKGDFSYLDKYLCSSKQR